MAEIIQRARPDVLLINELDFVPEQRAAALFQRNDLSVSRHSATMPIERSFVFWPREADALSLVGLFSPGVPSGNGFPSSDHRLVAVDVTVPPGRHRGR